MYYIVYKMTNYLARHSNSCAIALFFENKEANTYKLILYTSYVSSIAAKEEAKALAHDQSGGVHCTLDFSLPLSHHYTYYPAFSGLQGFPLAFLSLGHWGTRACAFTPILLHTGRVSSG